MTINTWLCFYIYTDLQHLRCKLVWFGLVWFYDIVGYLMPNSIYTYISNIWFVNTFCRYTQLNDQTVLFLTIQFTKVNKVKWFQVLACITNNSIKHQSFVYIQLNDQTVLFLTIQFTKVNKVKWFQVLICITNNSIKHQSFVYIQLNDQTVQFSITHLFTHYLKVKQFYLTHR